MSYYSAQIQKPEESSVRSMGMTLVCSTLTAFALLRGFAVLFGATLQIMYGFNGVWAWATWLGLGYECLVFGLYILTFIGLMLAKDARESVFGSVPSPTIDSHETAVVMAAILSQVLLAGFGIVLWSIFVFLAGDDTADGKRVGTFKDTTGGATLPFSDLSYRGIMSFFVCYGFSVAEWMISVVITTLALLYYYTAHPVNKLWERMARAANVVKGRA